MIRGLFSPVACTLSLLYGCSQGPAAPSPQPSDLRNAPTSIIISGKRLTLNTYLYRDFMPIAPPDGKPLIAVLRVQTDDGTAVPAEVRADNVWVIHSAETWSAVPREERARSETMPVYEVVARDGPKWGPDVSVDVIVRLRDASGRGVLLGARNQIIGATF